MKKSMLKKYANLLINKGVALKKGQVLYLTINVDQSEFAEIITKEAYKAGAKKVYIFWNDDAINKLSYKYQSIDTLSKFEDWEIKRLEYRTEVLPCRLFIESSDPDCMKGINQAKVAKSKANKFPIIKPFLDKVENKEQWCIAAAASPQWAKKVFPNLPAKKATEKLWESILYTSRVWDNPIQEWEKHNEILKNKYTYLNSLSLKELQYSSKNGTNLQVGLIKDCLFAGGSEYTLGSNIEFNPNIPSEEIFTSPMKGKAEGIVYATKPLSYEGELIEDFNIRFENGKAVEVHAKKNEDLLKQIITMDENAGYLGECALIPTNSPINNSKILFYNTLFDENASCHLALGLGFTNLIKDYDKYTLDELKAKGINDSMIHIDFMIGTDDLDIVGITKDDKRVQIFKNGNWAF